jgi:hypothetical protein
MTHLVAPNSRPFSPDIWMTSEKTSGGERGNRTCGGRWTGLSAMAAS